MSVAGNSIFGFSFLFSKLALNIAEPFVLLTMRFLIAFLIMYLLKSLGVVKMNLKGKDLKSLLLLGLLQPVIYFICESYGIMYSSSSFAGIIIALIPIAGVFLGTVILKEFPTKLQILFSIVSVAGVILMTLTGELGSFQIKGFVILLGAVVSGALFSIQSRKIADQFTAFERTYIMFGVGTVVFGIMGLVQGGRDLSVWVKPLTNGTFWISIAYLAGASSVGAFMLLNKALDVLDVARSLVFANLTTVISVFAGVLILGEHFMPLQGVGAVLVILGVYCVNRFTRS